MSRDFFRVGLAAAAVLAVAGCDRVVLGPEKAASAPPAAVAAAPRDLGLRDHAGETYPVFAAAPDGQYTPDRIGIPGVDRVRLWRAMASASPSRIVNGGGAEALVFRGCAETGCGDGISVVAVDVETGAVFVAVKDAGGADVLAPNDRVEALLRLSSPTRAWEDPAPVETASAETARP